jgi:drug/metabolite transporter (DMT)-like permease
MDANAGIVIGSEVVLALYPLLIKLVPTNLWTQLLARFLVYTVLAGFLADWSDIRDTWLTASGASSSLLFGSLTLVHVFFSYFAFSRLPSGEAMSLFYTYPIWNLIGASFLFGEGFSYLHVILLLVSLVGVYFVTKKDEKDKNPLDWKGILAGLGAALTESLMYFVVRTKSPNPFYSILQLYPGGLVPLIAGIFLQKPSISMENSVWLPLILFNAIVGFSGYSLRFYAVPKVKTIVFSLLSFFGVLASFGWGYLFAQETVSHSALFGALLIAGAGGGATKFV